MTHPPLSLEDQAHLDWARKLGRRGWGRVHPNPLVGCVLVRDGRVVGEGYHAEFGGPHAEIVALEDARSQAEGATGYVSLEPCNHDGKTPPCSHALVQAGVRRVVYGVADPTRRAGGGAEALRAAGVEVVGPVWDDGVARAENPVFFHVARHDAPFVALKLAMSLDARIAVSREERTRITGAEAEEAVHRLRSGFDAVMVGGGTARVDNPLLTVRKAPAARVPPRRLILDPSAQLASDAAVFRDAHEIPLHVFTRTEVREVEIERLESAGAQVHTVASGPDGLDLDAVLQVAWSLGLQSVLCEGGARLAASLLREKRVHRLYVLLAPRTLGASAIGAFPDDAQRLAWDEFHPAGPPEALGRDTLLTFDRGAA